MLGAYAGSGNSYETFRDLFAPIINDYHDGRIHASQDLDSKKLKIEKSDASYVLSTRINIVRNLEKYPYMIGIDKEKRLELMNEVVDGCELLQDELAGKFIPFKGMGRTEQEYLSNERCIF